MLRGIIAGIIAALFLTLAFLIPFNYYSLIKFSVIELNAGWVFSTFYIRFVCIVFFVIALAIIFSFFKRTRKMKFIYVFLIGMLPGFGISFIAPIYNTDYGDLSDEFTLETVNILSQYTEGAYLPGEKRHLVCFFDPDCGHCRNTAAKIGINQMAGMELEVHAFMAASLENITHFMANNNGQNFHTYQMGNAELFLTISDFVLPSIFLVDRDGTTMKHWAGDVINYSALDYLNELEP